MWPPSFAFNHALFISQGAICFQQSSADNRVRNVQPILSGPRQKFAEYARNAKEKQSGRTTA